MKLKLLYPPDGGDGNGSAAAAAVVDPAAVLTKGDAVATSVDWNSIKDPETREAFGKMFPGMKSIEDLAKTAVHQQRKIGQQGVELPKKPEELLPFLQTHFKVPKDGKGYKFDALKVPDGLPFDKAALPEFGEHFAKLGLTQQQVDGVLSNYVEYAGKQFQGVTVQRQTQAAESTAALRKEWGADYDANLRSAEMALGNLGDDALKKTIMDSGLHNNLQFVKFLHTISGLMKEDPISGKMSGGGFAAGPQQAQQEIDTLMADESFRKQYFNTNDVGHKTAVERVQRLYKIKHGEIGRK